MVENGESAAGKKRQNDPKRFIKTNHATADGEVAEVSASYVDQTEIDNEEQYDGFYAVCTNLDNEVKNIVKVNQRRWEIAECFRIMKTGSDSGSLYHMLHIPYCTDIWSESSEISTRLPRSFPPYRKWTL